MRRLTRNPETVSDTILKAELIKLITELLAGDPILFLMALEDVNLGGEEVDKK